MTLPPDNIVQIARAVTALLSRPSLTMHDMH